MAAASRLLNREITFGSLKAGLQRFCAWERDELRAMLPPRALLWLMGSGAREAVVRAGDSDLIVAAEAAGKVIRISGAEISASSLHAALTRRNLSRKSVSIVLEMPASNFLTRQFEAPSAALGHLPQAIDSEIARKTPFRRDELLVGHHVAANGAKGKAKVQIALLRRDLIAPALENCGLALADLAIIRAEKTAGSSSQPPAIPVGDGSEIDRRFGRLVLAMCLLAALLVGAGLGAIIWRQSRDAEELDGRIADLSTRAAKVRQLADHATKESRLLAILHENRRQSARLTDLWEEVSRILPDSAYLTDFRLTEAKSGERTIELAGFAQSAVGLPLLLDQSKYFTEASLTAPITSDPRDKRESFSLRIRTRAPDPAATAVLSPAAPAIAEPPR